MKDAVKLARLGKPTLRFREAARSDIEGLVGIERLAFASDRLSRRSLHRLVQSPTASLLVAEAGRIVGYALVLFRANSGAARLYSLAVEPGSTGAGIGSRLLAAAEAAAARRGAETLTLEVRADNAGAIRFYRSRGYALFARRERYYADGMAALRLARPLNANETRPSTGPYRELLAAAADG